MIDPSVPQVRREIPTWLLVGAGALALVLSSNRMPIPLLGWVAPVLLMIATPRLRGWRGRGVLFAVVVAAGIALASKVVSDHIPFAFGVIFGAPLGMLLFGVLVVWDRVQRRCGPIWGIYAFVGAMVLSDYAFAELSPGGDWGAILVNSQLDNLPLLQLAAVGGLGLVTAVMAWPIAATATLFVSRDRRRVLPHLAAGVAALVVALTWGAWRLDRTLDDGPVLPVAGVTVDLPTPLTSYQQLRGNHDVLFARSELAAQRGARLVIWNEIATLVDPGPEEAALRARGADFARSHQVDLVMAYGVTLSLDPVEVENKYEWFGPDGSTLEVYLKHFIVPSDPNVAGTAPLGVVERPWGTAAGAICYDYDSPALARAHARGGAGLVALPASDWRGIDPYHSLMARVRAIEGGMSVVRPTRAATSMAFDAYGRIRATMSAWERNDHVMLATVPTTHVETLYARVGNWPATAALGYLLAMLGLSFRRRE